MLVGGSIPEQNIAIRPTGNSMPVNGTQAASAQSGSEGSVLTGLTQGDTINGKIMSRDGDLVQILLSDDSVLEAKLSKDMQMQPGQMISFTVKSSGADGTVLMPLFTNTADMSTASKALMGAGLPQTGQNLQMVSDMMREGMPVSKDSLQFMQRQISSNPSASVTNIVQMTHLGLKITPENIEQFGQYKNFEHQINDATNHIASLVPDTFESFLGDGLYKSAEILFDEVLQLTVGETSVGTEMTVNGQLTNTQTAVLELQSNQNLPENIAEAVKNYLTDVVSGNPSAEDLESLRQLAVDSNDSVVMDLVSEIENQGISKEQAQILLYAFDNTNAAVSNAETVETVNKETLTETVTTKQEPVQLSKEELLKQALSKAVGEIEQNDGSAQSVNTTPSEGSINISSTVLSEGDEQTTVSVNLHEDLKQAGVTGSEAKDLAAALKNSGIDDAVIKQFAEGKLSGKELLQIIKQSNLSLDDKTVLMRNPGFQKILKNQLSSQWKITPEQTASKTEVEELYKKIEEQTKELMNTLKAVSGEHTPLASSVSNLQNNLDFMNQMNQMFPYVQLPLKMSGSDAHGDLYVYTNKKNLAKEDGSVSALLHLDMEHLGTMNVHVKMNPNQHVNTNFCMENEAALDLVAKHLDQLTERLNKRGYQVDFKCSVLDEGTNIMEEIIEDNRNIAVVSSGSFDARA